MKTELRKYQTRIVSELGNSNGIIVLPTGSGKTVITASIIESCIQQYPEKRVLFLVPTCVLVTQQASVLRNEINNTTVRECYGKKGGNNLSHFNVIVSTPESFRQLHQQGRNSQYDINNYSLIVFDEVHHAIKNHPYNHIAKLIQSITNVSCRPRILGLTATLSYAVKKDKISNSITELCSALDIDKIVTIPDNELQQDGYYGTNCHNHESIDIISSSTAFPTNHEFGQSNCDLYFHAIVQQYAHRLTIQLDQTISIVESDIANKNFVSPIHRITKTSEWSAIAHQQAIKYGVNHQIWYCLEHLYEAVRLIVNSQQKDLELAFRYIEMMFPTFQLHDYRRSQVAMVELHSLWLQEKQTFQRFDKLKETLLQKVNIYGKNAIRGIVFVQQRVSTHIIQHFIVSQTELKDLINASVLYATGTPATPRLKLSSTESKQAIEQFKNGIINLLISTAVSEEGLDIPAANVVLRFDTIQNPISFVQRRGRARATDSSFVALTDTTSAAKRSLETMQQAQKYQADVLANLIIETTTNSIKKQKVDSFQHSCQSALVGGLQYTNAIAIAAKQIKDTTSTPFAILNELVTKTQATVTIDFNKADSSWQCVLNFTSKVLPCFSSRMVSNTKSDAKHLAAKQLLYEIIEDQNLYFVR